MPDHGTHPPQTVRPRNRAPSTPRARSRAGRRRKSECRKRYCECFQAGIKCGDKCKCLDCANPMGAVARRHSAASPHAARPAAGSTVPSAG
eukprot:5173650-Prymnesium_polylepis.1